MSIHWRAFAGAGYVGAFIHLIRPLSMAGSITWIHGPALGKTTWARLSERELLDRQVPATYRTTEELVDEFMFAVTHGMPAFGCLKGMRRIFIDDFDLLCRGREGMLHEVTLALLDLVNEGSRIFLLARRAPESLKLKRELLEKCRVMEMTHTRELRWDLALG